MSSWLLINVLMMPGSFLAGTCVVALQREGGEKKERKPHLGQLLFIDMKALALTIEWRVCLHPCFWKSNEMSHLWLVSVY